RPLRDGGGPARESCAVRAMSPPAEGTFGTQVHVAVARTLQCRNGPCPSRARWKDLMKLLMAIAASVAATALGLSVAAFVIADRAESSTVPGGGSAGGGATSPIAGSTAIDVELGDVYIKPQQLSAAAGEVVLNVRNAG